MNVRLLRRVAKHISEEPKRLYMHTYIQRKSRDGETLPVNTDKQKFAKCGTAACIAGWVVLLDNPRHPDCSTSDNTVGRKAQILLGITAEQSLRLFVEWYWPTQFKEAYNRAKTARGRATAAMRRIEHFIKTKGAE